MITYVKQIFETNSSVIIIISSILLVVFILLFLFSKYRNLLIFQLIESGKSINLEKARRMIHNLEAKKKYTKHMLYMLKELYLKVGQPQKALHYMQVMLELGFLKEDSEIFQYQLSMAQLLFDLNQTTTAFNKLISIKSSGIYHAPWCLLLGKIYFSQHLYEKAKLYFFQAVSLEPNSKNSLFYLSAINAILQPESAIYDLLNFNAFHQYYLADLLLSLGFFSKSRYDKSFKFAIEFVSHIPENLKESRFYIIIGLIIQELSKFYGELNKINSLKNYSLYVTQFLETDLSVTYKEKLLFWLVLSSLIIQDNDSYNFYLKMLNQYSEYYRNKSKDELLQFSRQFFKKLKSKDILPDFLLLGNKKPLEQKTFLLKEDFNLFYKSNFSSELRTKLLKQFNILSKNGFIDTGKKLSELLGYKIKSFRYFMQPKNGELGINIIGSKEYPHFHKELVCIRRFSEYRLDNRYLQYLYNLKEKSRAEKVIFISNMEYDKDFIKYSEDFPDIQIYDKTKLGYLLESLIHKKN